MNIYLDIDGVILANENNAALYADELLQLILEKYPDSTYWLTTHDWRGENTVREVLEPVLKPETMALLDKVKSTQWNEWKTEGIDFSQPFLWLDDDLYPEEKVVLEGNNLLNSHILINLEKDQEQLRNIINALVSEAL